MCLNCTTYSTTRKNQQLYIHHLNVIISPQNVTELKTLKSWCSICAIASPARISIWKAKALNQLYAHPTLRNRTKQKDAHPPPREKTKWTTLCHRNLSLCHGFLSVKRTFFSTSMRFTESFWNMLRASDINILQQVLCLFRYRKPLVRLSLTHWLITWFCLIYKISKSKKLSSIPMIANLAMQYKVIGKSFPQNSCSKST